ncbi:MAG TPA: choice-of-anchor D domain-containing protein [Terriglobales bacterium]|nr:choice-of-anchor D domain-containing protein [Terriglobales bacterium]
MHRGLARYALVCMTLAGLAPAQQSQFSYSYVLPTNLNVTPVQPGGTIVFPPTPASVIAQATLNISNGGPASRIQAVTISGAAFALQGLPLFPVMLNTGQTLQVLIRYQPSGALSDTGEVDVTSDQGTAKFGLQGTVSAPRYVYSLVQGTQLTPVTPGGTITLPDTNVGDISSVTLQVKNEGNLTGVVTSINLAGQDYSIVPVLLPQILAPGAAFSLTLNFVPLQPGNRQGSLYVGSDGFSLVGKGLGPKLVFSYASGGTTVTLTANNAVVFSPVMISQSAQLNFTVANKGTTPATIFNIGIGQATSPFSLAGLPSLPLQLGPNAQATFQINFTPVATGFSIGTLLLDTTSVPLLGSGTAPPPLPAYTIQGPSGSAQPMTQPAVSLKLAKPYAVAIAGTLALGVSSNLPVDPAVTFSIGGRTALFTIPANTTDAIFTGQGAEIQLQTGTVASTITLTPSFATQAGAIDLTPNNPATLEFTVPAGPPTLVGIQITSQTTTGFVLAVTGFSTTRSLAGLSAQFTAATGFSVPGTSVTVDLSQVAPAWFGSSASVAFGGQFLVQVPFTLHGTVPTGQTLLSAIASVSATVSNAQGTSNTLTANIQ